MATINKRDGKWQCQVRKTGFPSRTRTFASRADAAEWGRMVEAEMDRGLFVCTDEADRTTVADLLDRYTRDVSPTKRSGGSDKGRAQKVTKQLGAYKLTALTSSHLVGYRDARLKEVSPQTVIHELNLLIRALTLATRECGIVLPSGIPKVIKPRKPQGRDRRLHPDEIQAIIDATESPDLRDFIRLAVATGMRRGELASLRWEHINLDRRTAHLPLTKTDTPRTVPLSSVATAVLQARKDAGYTVPFAVTANALTRAFCRAVQRARGLYESTCRVLKRPADPQWLIGIRLHDLRHEATSRFFELGLQTVEVASITGHKTLAMLKRYTHLKAEDLAKKLG
ncbi:site-specific integrase [Burkholderia pseudomallei]|uniref:site-specific integrase n=1 Tax=Burkholderia pseudomallei TaxID=28450 RepID=UPI000531D51C|nr:site-specific integrase [Burkholderia pseudomallei]KGS47775.1 phage integrase family protein [Burkholderia pseudomallei MSHR5613]MBF3499431.1 site-specific integrase [Burkholderia pseudomallei]MBO2960466.1 site-specific integrase [Burkholderia pseudomallei]MBO7807920.1 site-specific integrase [Burkholderia pseudomallei]MBO7832306.1 site-specific integrase [Burkholderia pseudomallei]